MDIDEIKKYDDIVKTFDLNALIATNKSKGIWSGQQIPSDHLIQTWEQFVCKRIANNKFGLQWNELEDWGPKECRAFYNDRLLEGRSLPSQYQLDITDKAVATLMSGLEYPEGLRALSYRWDNGFSFKNYQSRVDFALVGVVDLKAGIVGDLVQTLKEAERILDSVRGELDEIAANTATSGRVKHLITHWQSQIKLSDFLTEDPE